jgi:hypothetical protein
VLEVTPEFGSSEISALETYMTRNRSFMALKEGHLVTVMAEAPKPEWDENLIAVPIPIRKGVQGFRVFIIHQDNQDKMDRIKTLKDLKALHTGSGAHWSTKTAMEQAGFTVVTGGNYDGLFGMLNKGRFMTFGRGINEAYKELKEHPMYPNLKVDNNVLLYIPLVTYFYVSPKYPELAERITLGLQRLIEDGTFDRFFYKRHCRDLLKADLPNRKIFTINNPFIYNNRMESIVGKQFLLSPTSDFEDVCKNNR